MKNEINFLPKQLVRQDSLSKSVKWLRVVALLFVFVVPVVSIVIFLLTFFSPLTQYQITEKNLIASSQGLSNKIAKMQFIIDRTRNATKFIASRNLYDQVIQSIYAQTGSDVSIISLYIKDNKISIFASSSSLLSLKTFETNLKNITLVHLTDFQTTSLANSGGEGNYTLNIMAKIQ